MKMLAHQTIAPSAAPTIVAMLHAASARHDGRVAFQARDSHGRYERVSFAELYDRADSFATALTTSGLQPGDRVGIVCENRLEWPIAFYGIVLAGGVAVPIYPALPAAEIESLVRRAGARFLVASQDALDELPVPPANVERIFIIGSRLADVRRAPETTRASDASIPFEGVSRRGDGSRAGGGHDAPTTRPDVVAAILFTSGTTGGPKGVILTHGNIMASVDSMARAMPVGPSDRLLLVLPLHHILPLAVGVLLGVAIGVEVTLEPDPRRVRQRLLETKPTLLLGVPALFEIMHRSVLRRVEHLGKASQFHRGIAIARAMKRVTGVNAGRLLFRAVHRELGGSLRFVISGGAALRPEIARQFALLGLPVLQGWGLTETGPATVQRWVPWRFYFTHHYERRTASVGPPLPGIAVKTVDVPEISLFVNVDGEGELMVRGPNVTAGYWQADEATRAAMNEGWFRTGDLGRIDREGNVWITGRRKYVIVLDSGEKVHPDEVEAALACSAIVEDVCVVPRSLRGRTHLCAVVYPAVRPTLDLIQRRGLPLSEAGVRAAVSEELGRAQLAIAWHKRPSAVVIADAPLPKTPVRKIARDRLADGYEFSFDRWIASAPEASGEEEG